MVISLKKLDVRYIPIENRAGVESISVEDSMGLPYEKSRLVFFYRVLPR